MDPVGPWSAYPPYNRLPTVQTGSSNSELHHHMTSTSASGTPSTTTAQLIPGFLSPPPVAYETVFSPLFHHASTKQSHYVTQHRQALAQAQAAAAKPSSEGEYHQPQSFFEQGATAWQQSSPFGILPHESVVPTTTNKTGIYENFNTHFTAAQGLNHLNSQLAANIKTSITRAQSPQVTTSATKTVTTQANTNAFFQVPNTFAGTDNSNKSFSSTVSTSLQQSCIVSSPSNSLTAKEYRVPHTPTRTSYLSPTNQSRSIEKPYAGPTKQPSTPLIQTKAQTKIYPELSNQSERQRNTEESQSSPISFTMDAPNRMNYTGSNSSAKRNQFQHSNYRHYQQGTTNAETDFQRPKSGSDYNTTGPDCSVVVPRRPSPLQAHSQASPIGHAQSPAYPMYNSPMNSISSPQQTSNNQVTPSSPLDVSVPRPTSQTSNVAYPSVITRALNTEKNYGERFERQQNNPQHCWDERNQMRKFQSSQNGSYSNTNNNSLEITARQMELSNRADVNQQRSATSGISDRQTYFETGHQVSLQDLSSCRGDPMSIVKNLQQTCQLQSEIKQETKVPIKRRKSSEKSIVANDANTPLEYYSARIPPPAHSSAANQQQQNGAYFDYDRWNLASPTKIFGSQTIHQQHQGLMVPHPHSHHPPPPLPYFPAFHLPPHPPEFSTSAEISAMTYNEQTPQPSSTPQFTPVEEQPKVVVPNIEEELNFLSETLIHKSSSNSARPNCAQPDNKNINKMVTPGEGFMNSYLKFLQGERDTSPPPSARGRKPSWSNVKTKIEVKTDDVNGVHTTPPVIPATIQPSPPKRLSQGDPQDDPRYFPLPKERKSNTFDSSDDGISTDEDLLFNKKLPALFKDLPKEKNTRKGRPCKPGGPTERKRAKQAALLKQKQDPPGTVEKEPIKRRVSSKRAAKEKTTLQQIISKTGEDDAEEPPEFADSDSDPAWTPLSKEEIDEEAIGKRGRRGRSGGRGRSRGSRNLISAAAKGAGIRESDGYGSEQTKRHKLINIKHENNSTSNSKEEAATSQNQSDDIDDGPFKAGEFVAIKSELTQEWPSIWRVDGRTLLQKYEPFDENGKTLYRNISTYTSWTPESKKQYISVPVKCKSEHPLETIVEFLKADMNLLDQDFLTTFMKKNEVYQDNFEVYIQTLISQALDSNFLTEIFQEQDEYFLSNVQIIDDITENKKQKLINMLRWPQTVQIAVSTWPCFNVIRELSSDTHVKLCVACNLSNVAVRVLMYGQPYNLTTLDGCQPDPETVDKKDFFMCRVCASRVELFNKITHQKYLMYIECAKRVAEKRQQDISKDTTFILNELLADEQWLTKLFTDVRTIWAEVDSLEKKSFEKMSTVK